MGSTYTLLDATGQPVKAKTLAPSGRQGTREIRVDGDKLASRDSATRRKRERLADRLLHATTDAIAQGWLRSPSTLAQEQADRVAERARWRGAAFHRVARQTLQQIAGILPPDRHAAVVDDVVRAMEWAHTHE
ncbi:hypothetical protein ACJMQP_03880 [Rhodopseudomonas palustris]